MKRFYNYTFNTVCIYIIILSIFSISNFELKDSYSISIHNSNKVVNSEKLPHKEKLNEEENESINIVDKEETTKHEEEKEPIKEKVEEVVNIVDTSSYKVLSTEIVNMSHYGHDCYGCTSGKTASGYNRYSTDTTAIPALAKSSANLQPLRFPASRPPP